MESIGKYILSIVAASILCGVVGTLAGGKGTAASLIRLISGIFLAFVVISPVTQVEFSDFPSVLDSFTEEGASAAAEGEKSAADAVRVIIKDRTESYILDKAKELNLELTVEVTLGDGDIPVPNGVVLRGTASPYARSSLLSYIRQELGIPKENIVWNE